MLSMENMAIKFNQFIGTLKTLLGLSYSESICQSDRAKFYLAFCAGYEEGVKERRKATKRKK